MSQFTRYKIRSDLLQSGFPFFRELLGTGMFQQIQCFADIKVQKLLTLKIRIGQHFMQITPLRQGTFQHPDQQFADLRFSLRDLNNLLWRCLEGFRRSDAMFAETPLDKCQSISGRFMDFPVEPVDCLFRQLRIQRTENLQKKLTRMDLKQIFPDSGQWLSIGIDTNIGNIGEQTVLMLPDKCAKAVKHASLDRVIPEFFGNYTNGAPRYFGRGFFADPQYRLSLFVTGVALESRLRVFTVLNRKEKATQFLFPQQIPQDSVSFCGKRERPELHDCIQSRHKGGFPRLIDIPDLLFEIDKQPSGCRQKFVLGNAFADPDFFGQRTLG